MNRTELPGALRAFAELHVGPFRQAEFRGWPHAESSVWCLRSEPRAFLKVFKQPRKLYGNAALTASGCRNSTPDGRIVDPGRVATITVCLARPAISRRSLLTRASFLATSSLM